MKIEIIPILKDNYAYLLQSTDGKNAIIDPGEAAPIQRYLDTHNLKLDLIINTHHHGDHTAGNKDLIQRYNCKLAAPKQEAKKIGNVDIALEEDSDFQFGGHRIKIIETPGHTLGHICLYIPDQKALFSGDTLFSMGCGRLFEASAEVMWNSLQKLIALPDDTLIYCGHEYTKSNGEFCLSLEPENPDLIDRYNEVILSRQNNQPTLPVTLANEKKTNSFIRSKNAEDFARIRRLKDNA